MDSTAANIDLEKATKGTSGEAPYSPNSQSTWESQNDTLNFPSPIVEQIVIDEDTDEGSGNFQPRVRKNARLT
jgi:hypothetical protein